jgi:hypothetical protein
VDSLTYAYDNVKYSVGLRACRPVNSLEGFRTKLKFPGCSVMMRYWSQPAYEPNRIVTNVERVKSAALPRIKSRFSIPYTCHNRFRVNR